MMLVHLIHSLVSAPPQVDDEDEALGNDLSYSLNPSYNNANDVVDDEDELLWNRLPHWDGGDYASHSTLGLDLEIVLHTEEFDMLDNPWFDSI